MCQEGAADIEVFYHLLFDLGEVCENPEVASTYYSNTDEKLIEDTVFIVEFDVKCSNKPEVRLFSLSFSLEI